MGPVARWVSSVQFQLSTMHHLLLFSLLLIPQVLGITTCPGFPGYCSESFPGSSCDVVCDVGRPNVPLCQDDGSWTDIPRCIEHDPGVDEQIPGLCPGIPGYCSTGFLNYRCQFNCREGADIDSVCTADGTWSPYPTCKGDIRELQDGCDGCPGPRGGLRNRTAELDIIRNTISDKRVPKVVGDHGGRKTIPSFAGNINIGKIGPQENPNSLVPSISKTSTRRSTASTTRRITTPTTRRTTAPTTRRTPVQSIIKRPGEQGNKPIAVSLFDRINNKIKGVTNEPKFQEPESSSPKFRQPQQPPPGFTSSGSFGVFEAVNLGGPNISPSENIVEVDQSDRFGEFETVKLRG